MPSRRSNVAGAYTVHQGADGDRAADKMIDLYWTGQLDGSDPVQGAADGTTALRAVRRAPENTGFDAALQVGRIVGGHFGEEAVVRIAGWMKDGMGHAVGHQELWNLAMQGRQALCEGGAISGGQHLGT